MNPILLRYLHNKLDLRRQAENWSWRRLSKEVKVHPSVFNNLKLGKPISEHSLQTIYWWFGPDVKRIAQLISLLQDPEIVDHLASVFHEFWSKQAAIHLQYGNFVDTKIGSEWLNRLSRSYEELLTSDTEHQRKCRLWANKALKALIQVIK
jgi:hypothetical protein